MHAPAINASWASMGPSLGMSSSKHDDAAIANLLSQLHGRVLLLIGDSSLRNQFMQLARIGLSLPREMPVARAVSKGAYLGKFTLPGQLRQPDRPDSSNGFWGGFPWLVASTPQNTTLIYSKIWGCSDFENIVRRARTAALKHRQRTVGFGGWPPHYVVWNFGLHLLHVYPARPVPTAAIQCALSYGSLVDASAKFLRTTFPSAQLIYRTSNAACDARFSGPWAMAARSYRCAAKTSQLQIGLCKTDRIARIQEGCQKRYNMTLMQCVDTFMDAQNTRAQQKAATAIFSVGPSHVHLFDAFALTERRCDATVDGRHYPRLLASINNHLLQEAWRLGARHER